MNHNVFDTYWGGSYIIQSIEVVRRESQSMQYYVLGVRVGGGLKKFAVGLDFLFWMLILYSVKLSNGGAKMKVFYRLLISMMFQGFARVSGPLFSLTSSGSIGKCITFATWKGRAYCRKWFIPQNPNTALQVNVRAAFALAVGYWTITVPAQDKVLFDVAADAMNKSGFNLFMTHAMDEYMAQLGSGVLPTGVSYVGVPPAEIYTWV